MEERILVSLKKVLGLDEDRVEFDEDIIMHANAAFSTLFDLGIAPSSGFMIEDASAEWSELVTKNIPLFNDVRSYVALRVRMLFDPPETPQLLGSFERQIKELEYRMTTRKEALEWVPPVLPSISE